MPGLPIIDREIRVRARQYATYGRRIRPALVAMAISALALLAGGDGQRLGLGLFRLLSWLMFLFCLTEGIRTTADSLSEEKRAGTLGLLFLADVTGFEVVLGKWAALFLGSFYALLAMIPMLGLPFVMGGVTLGEFWRTTLALITALLLSSTTGILVSAVSRDRHRAWWSTASLLLLFTAVPPLLKLFPGTAINPLAWASPGIAFLSASHTAYVRDAGVYWSAVVGTQVASVILLLAASFILPRAWQDRPLKPQLKSTIRLRSPGSADRMRGNPVFWLAHRSMATPVLAWLLAGLAALGASFAALDFPFAGISIALLIYCLLVHWLLAITLACQVCWLISEARQSGLMELLLSTPMTTSDIVDGYFHALQRRYRGPVLLLVWAAAILVLAQLVKLLSANPDASVAAILLATLAATLFGSLFLDYPAVASYGMWAALTCSKSSQAISRTLARVLLIPLAGVILTCLYPLIGLLKNLHFMGYRKMIVSRLRKLVTDPESAAAPPWFQLKFKPPPTPLPRVAPRS